MARDRQALDLAAGTFVTPFFSRANAEVAGVTILASRTDVKLPEDFGFEVVREAFWLRRVASCSLVGVHAIFADFNRLVGVTSMSFSHVVADLAAAALLLQLPLRGVGMVGGERRLDDWPTTDDL